MKLTYVLNHVNTIARSDDGKRYYSPRPMVAENYTLRGRLRGAWRVLTGKADALEWDAPTFERSQACVEPDANEYKPAC